MTSSIRAFYIANQIARRETRFLVAGTIMFVAVMLSGTAAWSQTCSSTVNDTVKICSPVSGSTAASPVQFNAGALDTAHPITGMVLYLDSVNKASSTSAQITAGASQFHQATTPLWSVRGIPQASSSPRRKHSLSGRPRPPRPQLPRRLRRQHQLLFPRRRQRPRPRRRPPALAL